MKKPSNYGPLESENVTVGTVDAESPEAREDDHGLAALRKKRAKGGKVTGEAPKMRLDRRARGGKVNGKGTRINIIVAPGAAGAGGAPGGAPPPPGPMMPPPGALPPRPPQPMPPQMAGAGAPPPPAPSPMRKDGGRVPHMTAGAGNGDGRDQKIKAYGKKAFGADR